MASGSGSGSGGATFEDLLVGSVVSLKSDWEEVVDGTIVGYDRRLRTIAISSRERARTGEVKPPSTSRVLKCRYAEQIIYHCREPEDPFHPKKSSIDFPAILEREKVALRKSEEEAERIRYGVTLDALYIFDILSAATVKWDNTDIVVMNEVRICSPYLPENVHGGTPAANEYIKKVLELIKMAVQEALGPDQ